MFGDSRCYYISINRTKVELKSASVVEGATSTNAYQSYQSGIEISILLSAINSFVPINRTKVELKFDNTIAKEQRKGYYQSYQSGIEITIKKFAR